MRVSVLGTGDVGKAIARGFGACGYEVKIGSRDQSGEKARACVQAAGAKASAGSFAEAAQFGEIAVLCTPWSGTQNAISLIDPKNVAGKVVIDVTNPLVFHDDKPPTLALGHTDSGGEQVQRWLAQSKVVKAFNTVGNALFFKPELPGGPPDMFICGNDDGAKQTVTGILREFGWPAIDIGGIEGARLLEPMCILWVHYAIRNSSRDHAFKLLRG